MRFMWAWCVLLGPGAASHTLAYALQPRYQLFGASMDIVQSMEQSSAPGRVHVSPAFADALREADKEAYLADPQPDGTAFLATEAVHSTDVSSTVDRVSDANTSSQA